MIDRDPKSAESGIHIRPVNAGHDAEALAAIYAPHVTDSAVSFELEAPSAGVFRTRIERHVAGDMPWLVAERDGRCLGYAYAGRFRERAAYYATLETSAYIAREAQGHGIGRQLYQALFEHLAERGIRQAIAVITLPNAASVAFHERLGFHLAGRLAGVGWKFERAWDIGLYQRTIAPGER